MHRITLRETNFFHQVILFLSLNVFLIEMLNLCGFTEIHAYINIVHSCRILDNIKGIFLDRI